MEEKSWASFWVCLIVGIIVGSMASAVFMGRDKPDETAPLEQVNRLETLHELRDFEELEEEYKHQKESKDAYEKARDEWLKKYPPVSRLFDADRIHDTEYVIQYLKENPVAGDCALAWRGDVVCASVGQPIIQFPTER